MIFDVTISGPDANSYLSIENARERLNAFPPSVQARWDEATSEDLWEWLLRRGTLLIDQYTMWGPKKVTTQRLRFPRSADSPTVIPEQVLSALTEWNAHYLDGSMLAIKRLQAEGVTNASILGQSTAMDPDKSELPAGSRRELDQLKFSDWPAKPRHRDSEGNTQPGQTSEGIFYGGPG